MEASDLQKKITQTLAEAYNLLAAAQLTGLQGGLVEKAADSITGFREVISGLASGKLIITEKEDANEAK